MAAAKMVSVRVPGEVLAAVDEAAAAAGVKRSVWMLRALESALGAPEPSGVRPVSGRPASSSPSRPGVRVDSVGQAHEWAMARQARLNAAKERSSG